MSRSARSLFVFAIYLLFLGPALIIAPNALLSLFGVPGTSEVWIRVVGVLALALGYYDLVAARNEWTTYFRASVYARIGVLLFFTSFVLLGFAHPSLIMFGCIDGAGAMWTGLCLRKNRFSDTGG